MSLPAVPDPVEVVRPDNVRQQIPMPRGTRQGGEAPWAHLSSTARIQATSTRAIQQVFASLGPPIPSPRETGGELPASAVLAPIFEDDGETRILLTRRTMSLRAHRGEVSFPGGRQENGESLVAAARREAREEIGLKGAYDIVGELDHLSTLTSGSFIVPYVGLLPTRPTGLVANPTEVDAILDVALTTLLEPARFRSEVWPIPGGQEINVHFFDLDDGDVVWGATAAMLRQFLGFLTGTIGRGGMDHV